jgi:hypothetical protein
MLVSKPGGALIKLVRAAAAPALGSVSHSHPAFDCRTLQTCEGANEEASGSGFHHQAAPSKFVVGI